MGKVQVLAVLSMDGCLASELHGKSYKELCLDCFGINEIKENALYHITPDYSISMLDEWRRHETDTCYLAEASPEKTDYINGLLRMQVVDEIILYTCLRLATYPIDACITEEISQRRNLPYLSTYGFRKNSLKNNLLSYY